MRTYSLIFHDDGIGVARRIEFDALDPSGALTQNFHTGLGREAELWDGNGKLASVIHWAPGFWQIK
jgi:hypothetical protein